jgi:murein DD-endopeptidase MepM/ murein hydrolase activator NlpD
VAYLIAGFAVGVGAGRPSIAERAVDAPAAAEPAPLAVEAPAWQATSTELAVALEDGVAPAVDRMSTFLDVHLRNLQHRTEKWLNRLADEHFPEATVPDVSMLSEEPVKASHSSGFGWRRHPISGGRKFHKGTDYQADLGTPVHAAGPGIVIVAQRQDGYGKVVYIDHGAGIVTRYAHLHDIHVKRGQTVAANDQIGQVGQTGKVTGAHLHFEVRIDNQAVNPNLALDIAEMQRTLPPEAVRVAGMALLPEAQAQAMDPHDPENRRAARKNRPERSGRVEQRRDKPAI